MWFSQTPVPAVPPSVFDFAGTLASASPAVMLAIFIIALSTRRLVLPRELDVANARIVELERERDEYKGMALRTLETAERVASAVNERGRL